VRDKKIKKEREIVITPLMYVIIVGLGLLASTVDTQLLHERVYQFFRG
jgi:hypothetical protein